MKVLPYNMHSKSARALANELGCKRVRPDSPTFTNRRNHLIVNWGWGGTMSFRHSNILNPTRAVDHASSKLLSFQAFQRAGVQTPEWTTCPVTAWEWNVPCVARMKLRGHSGEGIVMCAAQDIPTRAPLFVKYIKKTEEYRYHVFNGQVIDIQMKRKRREVPNDEMDYQVRNHSNGWVYCRDNLHPDDSLGSMAIRAVHSLGLDFGAVDIIWNEHRQQGYVLEVNTACGLEGTTLEVYADAIRRYNNG